MSHEKKVIAVVGATGAQGSGLVRAILADRDHEFSVRALTRHPEGDRGRELARLGVDVVAADLDDPKSVRRAFRGAYAAFCVTNFWEHFSVEREVAQGRAQAEAAAAEGIRHVIWSTLEDTRKLIPLGDPRMPTLQGKYKVPHFDGKGEIEQYFRASGAPASYLAVSFYWENLIHFGMGPRPAANGRLAFTLPLGDRPLAGIAAEDIGPAALGLFKQGEAAIGKWVGIAGEQLTGTQMARAMAHTLGRAVDYDPLSFEAYRSLGFPGADDLGNMFQYYYEFNREVNEARNVDVTRALHPGLLSFSGWLVKHGKRMPIA